MGVQLFAGRGAKGEVIRLPSDYRRKVKWLPQIGDVFPDFSATTTEGDLTFHDWAEGNWVVLFSHPAAFTPVCTTELASLAMAHRDFAERGVKVIGLSRDSCEDQIAWIEDVERLFDLPVAIPLIEDPGGALAQTFGMIHAREHAYCAIRKTFILDPALRIRMIFEYPAGIGRGTEEILRVLDALQMQDRHGVLIGSDWQQGEECLLGPKVGLARARHLYGDRVQTYRDYLRVVRVEKARDREEGRKALGRGCRGVGG